MPKKQTQRGCALSKKRRKHHNKSVKQRGGDLHKMYSINNFAQDPQRIITVDRGLIQKGGNSYNGRKKHGHSRKYLKHGGSAMNYLGMEQIVSKVVSPLMGNNSSNSAAVQPPAYI
jgi:hypothetical protein